MVGLTPLDIHNKEFRKSLRGYDVDQVDSFLDQVVKDYEALFKDNHLLKEDLAKLNQALQQYKQLEETLHNTLILAQQTAEEVKKNAAKEADLIIHEANLKAASLIEDAQRQVAELQQEYERLLQKVKAVRIEFRSFLKAQLEFIEEPEQTNRGA